MKVCVQGLWHLGCVTSACLASGGHSVLGLDFDEKTVEKLGRGEPPLFEPGLKEMIAEQAAAGRLSFTTDARRGLADAEILWIAYDTPVDEDDRADVDFVVGQVERAFPHVRDGALVVSSSQLPVGTTRRLEEEFARTRPGSRVSFACSPENLRLGKAIEVFTRPDRVIAGVRSEADRTRIAGLLRPFTAKIEWMSVESAEMTKHAINAFLAASVTFANEIAALCEQVGADAKEVERGMKSESRIGPKAYVGPGSAYAGGTLARDIMFLAALGEQHGRPVRLIPAVKESNDAHKLWVRNRLKDLAGSLSGRRVAVLGLTYKPGTDTLRRSSAVELCRWLAAEGARVSAHDPAVKALPDDLASSVELKESALAALSGADAAVVATEWPDYRSLGAVEVLSAMSSPLVIDPNRFLAGTLGTDPRITYAAVGRPIAAGTGRT